MKTIVSIIIPHHNNSKILIDCINSLYKSTFEELEIIVVDNASTDSSCDDIMTTFPNVIVKKSDVNLGYAGGCNLGSQIANGQYLLFLNNDTIMDKNCVKSLVDRIKMNNEIGDWRTHAISQLYRSFFSFLLFSKRYCEKGHSLWRLSLWIRKTKSFGLLLQRSVTNSK